MNEVKHVLTALRSPAKSSTLNNGAAGVATATWYDVPAPIIVHCREFREEAGRDVAVAVVENGERKKPEETEIGSLVKNTEEETPSTKVLGGSSVKDDAKDVVGSSSEKVGRPRSLNEALYQNREAVLNDRNRKRHSTTLELNATARVETDVDGVPTISFSFLRADERFHEDGEEIVVLEIDTSDQTKDSQSESAENQLYDLPKSAVPARVSPERSEDKETSVESSSSPPASRRVLYDVPARSAKDASLNGSREERTATASSNVSLDGRRKQQRDQTKRSTRSLKSGRRSYGASDSDGYDAGIASMSGSYSDPECPNNEEEGSMSGGSGRSGRRMKLQKRRLGKAWGRMRSWLREERTRIGEVVNRHARLQAVGALSPEVAFRKSPINKHWSK
ncbi:nostrin-like isoform x1 protein [Lasius niger]|uniref:Nostrin-like isoform x1 protein n=1 Tax=Lasius niger TaxID=67767 RepID=A0A0J7KQJ4_LASNI|nr:nostrin-like isoform x1 protein [Lasius niger]